MISWKTIGKKEVMFDQKTNRIYGIIKEKHGMFFVLKPNGTTTEKVFLTLEAAKKSCQETQIPFDLC